MNLLRQPSRPAVVALVLVLTLALQAAGAVAAGPGFPQARFEVTLSGESPAFLNGAWRISFLSGGRYTTEHPLNEVAARGRIVVAGRTVTFGRETGPVACSTTGRYRWSYTGTLLRLTAISDACGGREIVLTAKPFKRVSG